MTRFRSFYKIPRFGKDAAKIYIQIGFMKKPGKKLHLEADSAYREDKIAFSKMDSFIF